MTPFSDETAGQFAFRVFASLSGFHHVIAIWAQRRRIMMILLGASLLGVAACAGVPKVIEPTTPVPGAVAKPDIVGTRGPLTTAQSKAVLARLTSEPGDAGLLQRHVAIEEAIAETPLIAGNRTQVLRDGPASFRALFAAIRGATHSVNLEFYIFEDVESDGEKLGDLLVAKCQAGVTVNVIYDSFGSAATPGNFIDRLKKAGVKLVKYNPLDPFESLTGIWNPNDRDHRKIVVADGATAVIGGVNLSKDYESNPFALSGAPGGMPMEMWRDTDLLIQGPAVAQLQRLFLDHWNQQKGPPLADADFFPTIPPMGTTVMRIIGSSPDESGPRYYVTVLTAMRNAEKSIRVTTAYFVPTPQEVEDLKDAARRGVDVRLIVPDKSDSGLSIAVGHSHYTELLEAGAKIFETHNLVLHSKTISVDGVWSVIGSSNFDHRSVIFNDEVDAVVLGSDTADALEAGFQDDESHATAIDLEMWRHRSALQKLTEVLAVAWQDLL